MSELSEEARRWALAAATACHRMVSGKMPETEDRTACLRRWARVPEDERKKMAEALMPEQDAETLAAAKISDPDIPFGVRLSGKIRKK